MTKEGRIEWTMEITFPWFLCQKQQIILFLFLFLVFIPSTKSSEGSSFHFKILRIRLPFNYYWDWKLRGMEEIIHIERTRVTRDWSSDFVNTLAYFCQGGVHVRRKEILDLKWSVSEREEKVVSIPIGKGFHCEPFLIASSAGLVRDPQILIKASRSGGMEADLTYYFKGHERLITLSQR